MVSVTSLTTLITQCHLLHKKSHVSINKKNNHHKNCLLVDINNLVKFHFEFGCKTLLVFDYA